MKTGKEIIGQPIYSVTEGRMIGSAKDLYVDVELEYVTGVFVGQEGVLRRRALLIPRFSIKVFGEDAILTYGPDVVVDSREFEEAGVWMRRSELKGREVSTEGGTPVGIIGDILVDEEAAVAGFTLSKVYVEGPLADSRVIMKSAIIDTGQDDGVMTISLSAAEWGDGDTGPA